MTNAQPIVKLVRLPPGRRGDGLITMTLAAAKELPVGEHLLYATHDANDSPDQAGMTTQKLKAKELNRLLDVLKSAHIAWYTSGTSTEVDAKSKLGCAEAAIHEAFRLRCESAAPSETEDDVAIDVYEQCAHMLRPYVARGECASIVGTLPGSVHDSFQMLLEWWVKSGRPDLLAA